MDLYIVCMDSYRVRDAQMFDTVGISDQELLEIGPFDENVGMIWSRRHSSALWKLKTSLTPDKKQVLNTAMTPDAYLQSNIKQE